MKQRIHTLNKILEQAVVSVAGKKCKTTMLNLAEPVLVRNKDAETTMPAIVTDCGECFDVFGEADRSAVTIYHRMSNIGYGGRGAGNYGSHTSYTQTVDLSAIVYGRRVIDQYSLEKALCAAISRQSDCVLVSSDFNAVQVFASEYQGMPFILNPNFFLFKINYRVIGTFDNRCIK